MHPEFSKCVTEHRSITEASEYRSIPQHLSSELVAVDLAILVGVNTLLQTSLHHFLSGLTLEKHLETPAKSEEMRKESKSKQVGTKGMYL